MCLTLWKVYCKSGTSPPTYTLNSFLNEEFPTNHFVKIPPPLSAVNVINWIIEKPRSMVPNCTGRLGGEFCIRYPIRPWINNQFLIYGNLHSEYTVSCIVVPVALLITLLLERGRERERNACQVMDDSMMSNPRRLSDMLSAYFLISSST